jgi:3'-phosphoadenosine 5'-phosphosulfate sulfotransferase (PAPS reductase)/FAD synthetase
MQAVLAALPQLFPAGSSLKCYPRALAVAYSGGRDSTALLHLAHSWAKQHGLALLPTNLRCTGCAILL